MTFPEMWTAIEARNPTMATGAFVRMPKDQFKRALQMAYDEGMKAGKLQKPDLFTKEAMSDIFGAAFGGPGRKSPG